MRHRSAFALIGVMKGNPQEMAESKRNFTDRVMLLFIISAAAGILSFFYGYLQLCFWYYHLDQKNEYKNMIYIFRIKRSVNVWHLVNIVHLTKINSDEDKYGYGRISFTKIQILYIAIAFVIGMGFCFFLVGRTL